MPQSPDPGIEMPVGTGGIQGAHQDGQKMESGKASVKPKALGQAPLGPRRGRGDRFTVPKGTLCVPAEVFDVRPPGLRPKQ